MRKRVYKYLFISLIIHGGIFLYLVKSHVKKTKEELFEIKIVETKGSKNKATMIGSRGGKGSLFPRLKNLIPQYGLATKYGLFKDGEGGEDNPLSEWGSGSGDFKRVEQLSLMLKVYNQMQNLLYYPGVLANHGIEGNVNARLVLNEVGSCDWHRTQISSTQTYFKVFVLSLLKDLCKQNWKNEVKGRRLTNLDLSFQFAITEHDDWKYKKQQSRIAGNVLFFYTNTQSSVMEWRLGPFKGMFPIPVINLDFNWLKENWEKVIEKKDPFREFKTS